MLNKGSKQMAEISLKDFNKKIGYRIYLRRKILKMTQKDIADKLGITAQCVQSYESGKNSLNIYYMHKIAKILGVNVNYFFYDVYSFENEITVLDNSALNIRNQKLLKNFINIKDKKIGKTIEKLIEYICDDKK